MMPQRTASTENKAAEGEKAKGWLRKVTSRPYSCNPHG